MVSATRIDERAAKFVDLRGVSGDCPEVGAFALQPLFPFSSSSDNGKLMTLLARANVKQSAQGREPGLSPKYGAWE